MNFNDFLALTPSEQKKTYENLREENQKLNNENKKLFQLSIQSISEEKKAELEKKIQNLRNEISEKNLLITKHQNEILMKDVEIRNSVSESEIALEETGGAVKANRISQLAISELKRKNFELTDQIALIEKESSKQIDEQSKIIENLIGENSRMLIEIYNLQNGEKY